MTVLIDRLWFSSYRPLSGDNEYLVASPAVSTTSAGLGAKQPQTYTFTNTRLHSERSARIQNKWVFGGFRDKNDDPGHPVVNQK
jgi:hypothetical protein